MVNTWNITIPELTGSEERRAYVYLPDSYEEKPARRYPVLYMFDGHNVFFDSHATFGKSWGLKEYLDSHGTEIIVAAVECNHSPDHGRLKEYSPFSFSDPMCGDLEGKGKLTMDWLVDTFKPYIDANYRTLKKRDYTWIAGSSMGGLMSLYAVTAYNKIFSRAAALSPSVWTDVNRVKAFIKSARLKKDTVVYMDYGTEEFSNHEGMLKNFSDVAALLLKKGVCLESRIIPGGNHSEASWERQIPFFMQTLFYGVTIPERKKASDKEKTASEKTASEKTALEKTKEDTAVMSRKEEEKDGDAVL